MGFDGFLRVHGIEGSLRVWAPLAVPEAVAEEAVRVASFAAVLQNVPARVTDCKGH